MSKVIDGNSSITYVVDNLVQAGFVEKVENESDKRSNFVNKKGENYLEPIFPRHEEKIDEIFSLLTEEEVAALTEALKKIGIYSEKIVAKK